VLVNGTTAVECRVAPDEWSGYHSVIMVTKDQEALRGWMERALQKAKLKGFYEKLRPLG
jgi:hypothetical protein